VSSGEGELESERQSAGANIESVIHDLRAYKEEMHIQHHLSQPAAPSVLVLWYQLYWELARGTLVTHFIGSMRIISRNR